MAKSIFISVIALFFLFSLVSAADCPSEISILVSDYTVNINDPIKINLKDASDACQSDSICFKNYQTAELVLPSYVVPSSLLVKSIDSTKSIFNEDWVVRAISKGEYDLKMKLSGEQSCEFAFTIKAGSDDASVPGTPDEEKSNSNKSGFGNLSLRQIYIGSDIMLKIKDFFNIFERNETNADENESVETNVAQNKTIGNRTFAEKASWMKQEFVVDDYAKEKLKIILLIVINLCLLVLFLKLYFDK